LKRPRARELGWIVGRMPPGQLNAITDVPGVLVGHTTLFRGGEPSGPGRGPVRTGVTVVLPHPDDPFKEKVRAAVATINGYGKAVGFEQVRELGVLESPIALTGTLNVGKVMDALVQAAVQRNTKLHTGTGSVNVVVGEIYDGYLNEAAGRHVQAEDVFTALENASAGLVPEGNVGGGTGAVCFGWKGGMGTASRVIVAGEEHFTLGVLVQANFGHWRDLTVLGVPVGQSLAPDSPPPFNIQPGGSVMIVMATDVPLDSRQLGRVARRAGAGIARLGSSFAHSSGDFVIAFSTAVRLPQEHRTILTLQPLVADERAMMAQLFPAAAEAVEEAVLNALCAAKTTTGWWQHTAYELPTEQVSALLRKHGRL